MDEVHELIDRLLPYVLGPVRRVLRRAVEICAPQELVRPGWLRANADTVAREALGSLILGNADPAGFSSSARELSLWEAALRCEQRHMATLCDLSRAGLLPAPLTLHRHDDQQQTATVKPLAAQVAVEVNGSQHDWLVHAARAAVDAGGQPPWRPQSDARFWRYRRARQWVVLDLDNGRSVGAAAALALDRPEKALPLCGYYLGFPAAATFFLRDGQLGIAPADARCEERLCSPEAIRDPQVGYAELVETARDVRRQILEDRHPHQGWRFWRAANGADLEGLRRRFWAGFREAADPEAHWLTPGPNQAANAPAGLRHFLRDAIVGGDPGQTRDFTRGLAFSLITLPNGAGLGWGQVLDEGTGPRVPSLRIFDRSAVRRLTARRCGACGDHAVGAVDQAPCPRPGCLGRFLPRTVQVCVWRKRVDLPKNPPPSPPPLCPED